MRLLTLVLLLGVIMGFSMPSWAGEKAGVTLPDQVQVDGKTLVLNGMGVREATVFKVDVYVAGLYLVSKSSDPAQILDSKDPKQLTLKFVRDVSRDDITKAWSEGFDKNAGGAKDALKDRVARLNSWMSAMNKGESLSFTYLPGRGIEVKVKGASKGIIEGDDFARVLYSIWLGPRPPNSGLKSGLLGR